MRILTSLFIALLFVGCQKEEQAEVVQKRFGTKEMQRFTIIRESTPMGYPDLFLIQDSVSGAEILCIESPSSALAAIKLK